MLAIIRGAGDIATAIALRLWKCGISVVMTEIEQPLTVRRTVAFSEAVRLGQMQVEGVLAICVRDVVQAKEVLERKNAIPVLVDPDCRCIELKPDVVVDAILAKRNLGTSMDMASVVVGVGPGFTAGEDSPCGSGNHARSHSRANVLRRFSASEYCCAWSCGRVCGRTRFARSGGWLVSRCLRDW